MDLLANEVELVTELCMRISREKERTKSKTASLRILDIGCGTGKLAVYLSEETGSAVTGIDPVQANVEKARMETSSVSFEVQSAEELTFANDTFDFAVSLKALHETQNPREALREARRVVKEGGKIFIVDWVGGAAETNSHAHVKKYFSSARLKEALSDAGFVNLSIKSNKEGELMLAEGKKIGLE